MEVKTLLTLLPRLTALALAISLLNSYAVSLSAATAKDTAAMGSIFVAGDARVNGHDALSGGTLFSDSTVDTGQASMAVIRLDKTGSLELAEETTLTLSFNASSITGTLSAGRARVSVPAGTVTSITASDVSLLTDSNQPALFSVKNEKEGVTVMVEAGELKLTRAGETKVIRAGDLFSTVSDSQQQSPQQQNLSGAKKLGLALGIGGAVALIALLISGQSNDKAPTEPCVVILSGEQRCP